MNLAVASSNAAFASYGGSSVFPTVVSDGFSLGISRTSTRLSNTETMVMTSGSLSGLGSVPSGFGSVPGGISSCLTSVPGSIGNVPGLGTVPGLASVPGSLGSVPGLGSVPDGLGSVPGVLGDVPGLGNVPSSGLENFPVKPRNLGGLSSRSLCGSRSNLADNVEILEVQTVGK